MNPQDADQRWRTVRNLARRALLDLARDGGAEITSRPLFRGSQTNTHDIEPLAGLASSRQLELAAGRHARDYVRDAREAGYSWHDIGTALGLVPGGDAQQAGDTVAEAAFSYAAGHPDTEHARRYGRSIGWHCHSCDRSISDHGLCNGPADDERGHAGNCARLAATIATRNAEWDALDAEWESGQ